MRKLNMVIIMAVLVLPLHADAFFAAGGLAAGVLFGRQAWPVAGGRIAAGWAFDSGLELGAETGISGGSGPVIFPAAVTAAWRFPLGRLWSIAPGAALGGAAVFNGGIGFDALVSPRVEAELREPSSSWGVYFSAGADIYLERGAAAFGPMAGVGLRYSMGNGK